MRGTRRMAAICTAGALVFVGAACSSSDTAQKVAEKAAEKAAEDAGNGDVDVNLEDGKITYKDDQGNETQLDVDSEDGKITYKDDQGNEYTNDIGATELPADFPKELAPPDGVKILAASTSSDSGTKTITVTGGTDASVDDMYNGIKSQLADAGYTIELDSSGTAGPGGAYANLTAKKGDVDVTVIIAESSVASQGKTVVNMTVTGIS